MVLTEGAYRGYKARAFCVRPEDSSLLLGCGARGQRGDRLSDVMRTMIPSDAYPWQQYVAGCFDRLLRAFPATGMFLPRL